MAFILGGVGTVAATAGLFRKSIIVPYVRVPARPDRFYGDPEIEVEIAGKWIHARLVTECVS